MYISDKPIEGIEDDLLGRGSFSKQLAQSIINYKSEEGLVIGLFGTWGSGKTSILNMTMEEIESISGNDKPVIIRFSPWNYSESNNLIMQFFQCLSSELCRNSNKKKEIQKEIGEALGKYVFLFDGLKFLPYAGDAFASVAKEITKNVGQKLSDSSSLNETKEKLEKVLKKYANRIIVVIDDIDRLTKPQIRDVFQLVKQVCDFPNIIYVLVMDKEIVVAALEDIQSSDGNEYLEKIVQVPFDIPEVNKARLESIFIQRVNDIIKKHDTNIRIDKRYWDMVYLYCVKPYLSTIRDINRFINVFGFKFEVLFEETSVEDLIALTITEVMEPNLYKWIAENKETVCGLNTHIKESGLKKKSEENRRIQERFSALGIDTERTIRFLETIFPTMYSSRNYENDTSRKKMRVSNAERFDIYFRMNVEDVPVSRSDINKCIYSLSEREIVSVIKKENKNGHVAYFLREVDSLVDAIPKERRPLLVKALFKTQASLKNDNSMFVSTSRYAVYCARKIIETLNMEERFSLFRNIIEKGDYSDIGAVSQEMILINSSFDENSKSGDLRDRIITEKQLHEVQDLFCKRMEKAKNDEKFIDAKDFILILELWKQVDKNAVAEYMRDTVKCPKGHLKYACHLANEWVGSEGIRWDFELLDRDEYTSREKVNEEIVKYDKKQLSKDLNKEELSKIASFWIVNNKGEEKVSNEAVDEIIKRWKKGMT